MSGGKHPMFRVLLAALFVALCIGGVQSAGAEVSDRGVVVGILAHRGNDAASERWRHTLRYLQDQCADLRIRVSLLTLAGAKASLDRGELDFLLTNPGHFHLLVESHGLTPIASLRTDREGSPKTGNRYGAVIFAASNTDIQNIADLSGGRLAAVAPEAFGGFLMAAHTLVLNGMDPWKDLSEVRFFGFPQDKIVEAVLDGEADAGTVRTGLLETMVEEGRLEPDAVRIINRQNIPGFDLALSTQLFPEWIFASTPHSSEEARRRVAIALLSMPETHEAAILGRYSGWTTFVDSPAIKDTLGLLNRADASGRRFLGTSHYLAIFFVGSILLLGAGWRARRMLARTYSPDKMAAWEVSQGNVRLTRRECEVLSHIESGKTTKEIAFQLGISPKTVEYHRGQLMKKFDAHNAAELVHKAQLGGARPQLVTSENLLY
jgi:two-component system, LuxR family, sensor histidine kinase TtrS